MLAVVTVMDTSATQSLKMSARKKRAATHTLKCCSSGVQENLILVVIAITLELPLIGSFSLQSIFTLKIATV
uniref:Uncharacterized protein n=1 Tax=Arion vulgaris TaxID=1028688 RepID=A0A0B7ARB7_9EUPU